MISQFSKLSDEDKEHFLTLCDSFQYFQEKQNQNFALDLEAIKVLSKKQDFLMSEDSAAKIWGIFNTNNFEKGVFKTLSRINHSCEPNTEFVWNEEDKTQDLR